MKKVNNYQIDLIRKMIIAIPITQTQFGFGYGTSICGAGQSTSVSLFADAKINEMINAAWSASGKSTNIRCGATPGSNPTTYAVSVPFRNDPNYTYWCVDSSGIAKGHSSALTSTSCP